MKQASGHTPHCVIVAAGTGGHVMPGLAVGRALKAKGWTLSWVGTQVGMEARLVAQDAIPFTGLDFVGLRGRGLKGLFVGALKLVKSFFVARTLFKETRPDVMFTTGGYVSVPVGYAAKSLGIPVVVMNCDADWLMSTKMLRPITSRLACSMPGSVLKEAPEVATLTGNPVRADIASLPSPQARLAEHEGTLKLLVFGGSLGAKVFNDVVPEALALLPEGVAVDVLHQTGKDRDADVKALYAKKGIAARVVPFIDDMAQAYREADIVLCRAGATSIAELSSAGMASILVPFVASTTSHQLGNARLMEKEGAAIVMMQRDFTPEALSACLQGLTRDRILALSLAARKLAKNDAAQAVAGLIEQVKG